MLQHLDANVFIDALLAGKLCVIRLPHHHHHHQQQQQQQQRRQRQQQR